MQTRPTSFYWASLERGESGCAADSCAAEVLALGNPIIWWVGSIALLYLVWRWLTRRDWRAGAVLLAVLAGWVPWLLYLDRTIFSFYSVVFLPYLAMALAMMIGALTGPPDASRERRRAGTWIAAAILVLVVVAAWWFYPIWTGEVIPYEQWTWRMWMPTWV
jgi:dolichyl-phosphate-mannose--protein O-mannosyl transferase